MQRDSLHRLSAYHILPCVINTCKRWDRELKRWINTYITVIQVYAPINNAKEAEVEQFYEDLQDILELTTKKRCPVHYRGLECKSRKSRHSWSNRQIWPWSTKWSRAKANRILPRECTGHSKHPLPTTQERTTHGHHQMVNTKSDWLYSLQPNMEKLYTVSKSMTGRCLWIRSWMPYCQI